MGCLLAAGSRIMDAIFLLITLLLYAATVGLVRAIARLEGDS